MATMTKKKKKHLEVAPKKKREDDEGDEKQKTIPTPLARLSYPHLFTPSAVKGSTEKKYSAVFLFGPKADLAQLKSAAFAVARAEWGKDWKLLKGKKAVELPFKEPNGENPEEDGCIVVRAKSKWRPDACDTDGTTILTEEQGAEIMYPGCYVRAGLIPIASEFAGVKRVTFALKFVKKFKDGERLGGGGGSAAEFFDGVEETDAPDDEDDYSEEE